MIIDKVEDYRTEEDNLAEEAAELKAELRLKSLADSEKDEKKLEIAYENLLAHLEITAKIENRYIKDHTADEIVDDAREIINAIDLSDFQDFLSSNKKAAILQNKLIKDDIFENNYDNCRDFILSLLPTQLKALADNQAAMSQISRFIKSKLDKLYPSPFMLMAQSKISRDLPYMSSKKGEIEKEYGDFTATILNTTIFIPKYEKLKGTLGITTSKLLNYIIYKFTTQINFKDAKKKNVYPLPTISISLKEYAEAIGKPIGTKSQRDNFRKSIKHDCEILKSQKIKWNEINKKGEEQTSGEMGVVGAWNLSNGKNATLNVSLESTFSESLINGGLTQIPIVLLEIDPTDPNSYFIGEKLADHHAMDGNYKRGTHNRLKVKTLLERTDLPKYEDMKKANNRNWKVRIKDPFEKALNNLVDKYSFLKTWQYAHAKGIPLTSDEIKNIKKYDDFVNLYILFETVNEPERKGSKRIDVKEDPL